MKALICGDIHGNLIALEKILRLESGKYDIFVFNGDIVNYGQRSNEFFDLIHYLRNRIVLKVNH